MEATPAALSAVGRFLATRGTGSYLTTTVTAPLDKTLQSLAGLAKLLKRSTADSTPRAEARPIGIHLEGPFISHARRGVHPPAHLLEPNIATLDKMIDASEGFARLITLAPELAGAPILPSPCRRACRAPQNDSLTAAEEKAGLKLFLFDGESLNTERMRRTRSGHRGRYLATKLERRSRKNLITAKSYGELPAGTEWRVSEGGGAGVNSAFQRTISLDPTRRARSRPKSQHGLDAPDGASEQSTPWPSKCDSSTTAAPPDAKNSADRVTGALYSMLAPVKRPAHPAGQWNHAKLSVRGTRFEHWIDGELALSGTLDDPTGLANLKRRWADGPGVYDLLAHPKLSGQIALQHHGDRVWFRNLKIREQHEGLWDF